VVCDLICALNVEASSHDIYNYIEFNLISYNTMTKLGGGTVLLYRTAIEAFVSQTAQPGKIDDRG
jgi:hypothetical protein